MVPWTPDTVLQSGETYSLGPTPIPVNISVDKHGIKFVGGIVFPGPGKGAAFNIKPGVKDFVAANVAFHTPNAPANKQKLSDNGVEQGPCLLTRGLRAQLLDCSFGSVNQACAAWPGSDGTILRGCTAGADLRAGFFYGAGGNNVLIEDCSADDSLTENLVRWSPQGTILSIGGLVRRCKFKNPGNKSVINPRHCQNITIENCDLTASPLHSAIGIGPDNIKPGDLGVDFITARFNRIHGGQINIHSSARWIFLIQNEFDGQTELDVPITVNGKSGTISQVYLSQNKGTKPPTSAKRFLDVTNPELVKNLIDDGTNNWR